MPASDLRYGLRFDESGLGIAKCIFQSFPLGNIQHCADRTNRMALLVIDHSPAFMNKLYAPIIQEDAMFDRKDLVAFSGRKGCHCVRVGFSEPCAVCGVRARQDGFVGWREG